MIEAIVNVDKQWNKRVADAVTSVAEGVVRVEPGPKNSKLCFPK